MYQIPTAKGSGVPQKDSADKSVRATVVLSP